MTYCLHCETELEGGDQLVQQLLRRIRTLEGLLIESLLERERIRDSHRQKYDEIQRLRAELGAR